MIHESRSDLELDQHRDTVSCYDIVDQRAPDPGHKTPDDRLMARRIYYGGHWHITHEY